MTGPSNTAQFIVIATATRADDGTITLDFEWADSLDSQDEVYGPDSEDIAERIDEVRLTGTTRPSATIVIHPDDTITGNGLTTSPQS
jgi:hypothetical protein